MDISKSKRDGNAVHFTQPLLAQQTGREWAAFLVIDSRRNINGSPSFESVDVAKGRSQCGRNGLGASPKQPMAEIKCRLRRTAEAGPSLLQWAATAGASGFLP
jgi:hypothetical protein